MKEIKRPDRFLHIIAGLLLAGFAIRLGCDYFFEYVAHPENSAPFSVYLLVRTLEFILPAAVCFIIARVLKKKTTCTERKDVTHE